MIFKFLDSSTSSSFTYVLKAAALSFICATSVSMMIKILSVSFPAENIPLAQSITELGPELAFLSIVAIAPLIETLLVGVLVSILIQQKITTGNAILITATIAAALHSLISLPWGLMVFLSFVIYTKSFVTWRQQSWKKGCLVSALVHGLHNLPSAVVIYFNLV